MTRAAPILVAFLGLVPVLAMSAGDEPLRIQVSIPPLKYLVERVGGARVDVGVVVEAGQSPETYEPTPRQVGALANADVFFGVGMPLEAAWRRQLRQSASAGPEWIDLAASLPARGVVDEQEEEADAHDHAGDDAASGTHRNHDGIDPHVWLSPRNARHMTSVIADVLGRAAPGSVDRFNANARELASELESLDGEIAELLKASEVDAFLVYHPAWGHFARAYGLEQISIEREGKEPGPRGLVGIIRRARDMGIATIFVDPRHGDRLARTVAEAIDARLEVLDPLAYDYQDNLRHAAQAISASRS